MSKYATLILLMLSVVPGCRAQPPTGPTSPPPRLPALPLWTDAERTACVAFWSRPGRTSVSWASARATLTPEASIWLLGFNRALRTASPRDAVLWNAWVDAKFTRDRWEASQLAGTSSPSPEPAVPGIVPASLLLICGNPPPLAAALVPKRYTINLGGEDSPPLTYVAPIAVSPRYPSYRSAEGVISGGVPLRNMPPAELGGLMQAAGLTPFEAHVVGAVSRLEGGFDAVNTYDTGFVSVGFIQFITAVGGNGSLATVLATEKVNRPTAFIRDFHSRGIDVTPSGILAVVDPATGAELTGADAVQKTIRDPRLVAVFQAAGRRSIDFRIAQIQIAKRDYYPAEDLVTLTLPDGSVQTKRMGDVLKSEAGMATAFDRKVNTGHTAPEVAAAAASVMAAHHLETPAGLMSYEREIVTALQYRANFLADQSLTQPPLPPQSVP